MFKNITSPGQLGTWNAQFLLVATTFIPHWQRKWEAKMKVDCAHFSREGRKTANEDSLMLPFSFRGVWWAAIADGLGGRPGGAIASMTATEAISAAIKAQHRTDIAALFTAAQNQLKVVAASKPELSSMGTTLSLIRLNSHSAQVGHVGDSRIYHLRGDGIACDLGDRRVPS
jgi:serine/threonine protein phosphatase PrpC